jgi:hypothetical protein
VAVAGADRPRRAGGAYGHAYTPDGDTEEVPCVGGALTELTTVVGAPALHPTALVIAHMKLDPEATDTTR